MTDIRGMSLVVNFGGVDVTIRVDDRGKVYPFVTVAPPGIVNPADLLKMCQMADRSIRALHQEIVSSGFSLAG